MAKAKGVSILISKEAPFTLTDKLVDSEGQYVFLKGSYRDRTLTLANVYFPNSAQITFYQKVIRELKGFSSGLLIMGGDINIPLDPTVDSSTRKSCITYRALKKFKQLLNSLQLVDTWRFLHPESTDFTFHSIPLNRHSCIDHLYISQRDLQIVTGAHIGIQALSDHRPISLEADLCTSRTGSNTWRLNTSLLTRDELRV